VCTGKKTSFFFLQHHYARKRNGARNGAENANSSGNPATERQGLRDAEEAASASVVFVSLCPFPNVWINADCFEIPNFNRI